MTELGTEKEQSSLFWVHLNVYKSRCQTNSTFNVIGVHGESRVTLFFFLISCLRTLSNHYKAGKLHLEPIQLLDHRKG